MSVISRTSLKDCIKNGTIVVDPESVKLNNCSIDISLHSSFYRQTMSLDPLDPYSGVDSSFDVKSVWEPGTLELSPSKVPSIRIDAQECLLVFSEQFIGGRGHITTMAKSKSSLARLGLDVCGSAGWGDIGYTNRWCFCLTNNSQRSIYLRPGTWFAQIVFLNTTNDELDYANGGQYQKIDTDGWTPQEGLPKPLSTR